MGRIVMLTGGARSGKSEFALRLAEPYKNERFFIATAEALDGEMAARIAAHKAERASHGWRTVEEPVDVARALGAITGADVVLLDCLTLWLTNVMLNGMDVRAEGAALADAIAAMRGRAALTLIVTNEVGLGIVPDNELARRFRDEAGRLNRRIAEAADEAYMLVSGLPVKLK